MTPVKPSRPMMDQSGEFIVQVQKWREEAQRNLNDLSRENDQARAEILGREAQMAEHEDIIARCNAALGTIILPGKSN